MSEELKPFQRVLVRQIKNQAWLATFFSHTQLNSEGVAEYVCADAYAWRFCIPYNEETAHLIGTTNSPTPPEPEFRWGDHVEVRDCEDQEWYVAIYLCKSDESYRALKKGEMGGAKTWTYCRHANW